MAKDKAAENTQQLRYYLYISDSKLDMLFEQIGERALKRVSAELKIDLKIASLTLRTQGDSGSGRIAKLQIVERYIDTFHDVGTIQSPGSAYFRGRMAMQWRWLGDENNIVWFQGDHVDLTAVHYVGLGGSRRHCLGQAVSEPKEGETDNVMMAFNAEGTMNILMAQIMNKVSGADKLLEKIVKFDDFLEDSPSDRRSDKVLPPYWPLIASQVSEWILPDRYPTQQMDFLAIPLAESTVRAERGHPVHGVIATPLYVAIAR